MKRYFCGLSYLWILLAMPVAASTTRIYVLNIGGTTVDVIDPVTNKIVQTIEGIPKSAGVAFSPDKSRAYITSEDEQSENALYVVDTRTGKILQRAPLSGRRGNVPAITKDGKRLLVCVGPPRDERGHVRETAPGFLDIVDTTSLARIKTLPMKGHDCYTTPDGKYWIAGSGDTSGNNFVVVLDIQSEEPVWKVPFKTGIRTLAIEAGPDGATSRLFVELAGFRGFAVVDFATHKEVARIKLPDEPSGFLTVEHRDVSPTHGTDISPDGKTLAVASRGSNAVFFYSLPELKLLGYVSTPIVEGAKHPHDGGDPGWVTFSPDSRTVYVANAAVNSVSGIDVKALKVVTTIPVGKEPTHVWTMVMP
jgi:YVTN family beta-propeller protein